MIRRAVRGRRAACAPISSTVAILVAALAVTLAAAEPAAAGPLEEGLARFSSGDLAGAEQAFSRAVARDPDSAEAHFHLGLVHARQGHDARAVEAYDRALALDPSLPDLQLSRGIALHRLDRHADAEAAFQAALRQQPDEASALLFLGLSRIAQGKSKSAVAPLQAAARKDASLAQLALYNAGLAQWQSGSPEAARRTLDEAIALDPASETARDARQLQELTRAAPARRERRWSLAGSMGWEYDDNVTQSDIDAASGSDDFAGVFELSPAFRLLDDDRGVVEVGYDLYQSLHDAEDEFDAQTHGVFLDLSREFGPVDTGLVYRFDHSSLGGDDFLQIHGVRPSLGFTVGSRSYVDVAYQFQDRDFEVGSRDAKHHDVGFDGYVFFQNARGYLSAGYRVVSEDADGAEFDFLGHIARLGLKLPLPVLRDAAATLRYEFSLRDYDEVTPSIGSRRDDRRHSVRLGLEHRIADALVARLDYEFVESNSNLPSVDFTENVVGMSLGFDF